MQKLMLLLFLLIPAGCIAVSTVSPACIPSVHKVSGGVILQIEISPTQTACAPGCWLHVGTNGIMILDLLGPEKSEIAGLAKPILNELHSIKDF